VTDILQSGRHLLSIVNQLLDMALIGLALTKRLIEGLGASRSTAKPARAAASPCACR
jgi:hypothetical protein